MDILECECHAQIKSVEVGDSLKVYGETIAKTINSNNLINTGKIESSDIVSHSGSFKHLKADVIEADKVVSKSDLVFGSVEFPQIFLPNEKRYIDVDFPLNGLRGHGYGFAPTQALDTILVKIKTEHKLESSDIKVGFSYYNAKDSTPSVYKLGEVLYPVADGILAVVKLSGNLPIAPYWSLTVDILPF
jgi:hypothetical protein